eukprot:s1543_g30.t1
MVRLKSRDGDVFDVESWILQMSPVLSDVDSTDEVPLPLVGTRALKLLLAHCAEQRARARWTLSRKLSIADLEDLFGAAHILALEHLAGLCATKLADCILQCETSEVQQAEAELVELELMHVELVVNMVGWYVDTRTVVVEARNVEVECVLEECLHVSECFDPVVLLTFLCVEVAEQAVFLVVRLAPCWRFQKILVPVLHGRANEHPKKELYSGVCLPVRFLLPPLQCFNLNFFFFIILCIVLTSKSSSSASLVRTIGTCSEVALAVEFCHHDKW